MFSGNPHSPFSLGPETPPPAYSPHDDGGGGGGGTGTGAGTGGGGGTGTGERPPNGQSMDTDNAPLSEPVPYQVTYCLVNYLHSRNYVVYGIMLF